MFEIINKEGLLLDMNYQGLKLIEADSLESVLNANVYDLVVDEHKDKFKEFNQKICSGLKGTLIFEIIGLKGTRRHMETYAAPFKLVNGEVAHIAITNDISEKIKDQKEYMKQKEIALHQSKLAAIGELAAGVGHEINNPLAIVKGYVETVEKKSEENNLSPEELIKYTKKINLAVSRISKIVDGLRTFSRADSDLSSVFYPVEAVEESIGMVKEIYEKEGINLELYFHDKNMSVFGNRGRFQQILVNLISNAKDSIINKKNKKIKVSIIKDSESMLMKVEDNGNGIPYEIQNKIFDPFFTTKEVNKGTGIGLALVNSFLKEMNGNIYFETKENEGTTFFVSIPLTETKKKEENKDKKTKLGNYEGNVLIVDDEPDLREILSGILINQGCNVTEASNGLEAYEKIKKNPDYFNLIITDIQMPKMTGIELVKKITETENNNSFKIALISGGVDFDISDKNEYVVKHTAGFVNKPFNIEELKTILEKTLKKIVF